MYHPSKFLEGLLHPLYVYSYFIFDINHGIHTYYKLWFSYLYIKFNCLITSVFQLPLYFIY